RQWKQFFLGKELFEQLRLMWHRAEPTADVNLEAALDFPINRARGGDATQIVHRDQRARFVLASAERDLELPAEVLCVGMAQQVIRARFRVRRDVEGLGMAHAGLWAGGD